MSNPSDASAEARGLGFFERYLYVWIVLCILGGTGLGRLAPGVAQRLDGLAIYVGGAPVVSIPIAVCLFFMMYPIMVKIDFAEVLKAGRNVKRGRDDTLFSDDAVGLIHQTSRGYPRAANNLALQALVAAFAADKAIVDESSTRAAIAEVTAD